MLTKMESMNSITFMTTSTLVLYILFSLSSSTTVSMVNADLCLDWTISYAQLAPLGIQKEVIVINGQFPGPLLNVTTNDVVNINIHNNITDPFLMTWNGVQLRRNSWQDGVRGTNCPILPGQSWTYSFQIKDQIGSFFYFPSLLLQKAAGGYGAIRVNNRDIIPLPFAKPYKDYDILIGDWFNADHRVMRASLDDGNSLQMPDGILINGLGPNQAVFDFIPGAIYRLRISNVGLQTSLNFRIQDHVMLLVETEGSYTLRQYYSSLDIHVGQSYSVLVTALNQSNAKSFYMVASSRFTVSELSGVGIVRYPDSGSPPVTSLPPGPLPFDYMFSMDQARSIRWDLKAGAARPNPQGSFRYGKININRTIVLENGLMLDRGKHRYTINGISFVHPDTPLKLADYFQLPNVFTNGIFHDSPTISIPALGTSVIDAIFHEYVHVVFHNPLRQVQTYHIDGYNFFVVGMEWGAWDHSKIATYNMIDAVSRSTVQVYPFSWTAIMVKFDNRGMWNLRSQHAENWYLGQELYIRVKRVMKEDPLSIPVRDEAPIPVNVIKCGRATHL